MPYRIADTNNGPFSEVLPTLEDAEAMLALCIQEGVERTKATCPSDEFDPARAEQESADFHCIVEVDDDGTPV